MLKASTLGSFFRDRGVNARRASRSGRRLARSPQLGTERLEGRLALASGKLTITITIENMVDPKADVSGPVAPPAGGGTVPYGPALPPKPIVPVAPPAGGGTVPYGPALPPKSFGPVAPPAEGETVPYGPAVQLGSPRDTAPVNPDRPTPPVFFGPHPGSPKGVGGPWQF